MRYREGWHVLKEYPVTKVNLEVMAVKRFAKYKKQPLEKGELAEIESDEIGEE